MRAVTTPGSKFLPAIVILAKQLGVGRETFASHFSHPFKFGGHHGEIVESSFRRGHPELEFAPKTCPHQFRRLGDWAMRALSPSPAAFFVSDKANILFAAGPVRTMPFSVGLNQRQSPPHSLIRKAVPRQDYTPANECRFLRRRSQQIPQRSIWM